MHHKEVTALKWHLFSIITQANKPVIRPAHTCTGLTLSQNKQGIWASLPLGIGAWKWWHPYISSAHCSFCMWHT